MGMEDVFDQPEEDFEIDGGGYSEADLGGGALNKEGAYHFGINEVVFDLSTVKKGGGAKSPSVKIVMEVLETVEGQCPSGTKYYHRLYVGPKPGEEYPEGSKKGVFKFCLGLGLAKEVEGKGIFDAETGNKIGPATIKRAEGLQCCAMIKHDHDEKYGDQYQIPWNEVYLPNDPAVADTPKNQSALASGGYFTPQEAAANLPSPPPAENEEAVAVGSAIDDDDLSDL